MSTSRLTLAIEIERFAIAGVFRIARGERRVAEVLSVTLTRDGHRGRGECLPYARYGESLDGVRDTIEGLRRDLERGLDRAALQQRLPAGAARNALDCALWDLEAKRCARRVWTLAGLPPPVPLVTAFTLSLDTPERMRAAAREAHDRPLLKIKLDGEADLARVSAVRAGAPRSRLIVDANESWSIDGYRRLAPRLRELGVTMIEQPLPAGEDAALAETERVLPVCADESCHDRASLPALIGRYDLVNIKLDKCGGLTEGLALRAAALEAGLGIMVGCMVASSLAMAPAALLAQGADLVDLDGALLLAEDRAAPLDYRGGTVGVPEPRLWG